MSELFVSYYIGVCNLARTRIFKNLFFLICHNRSFWPENAQCGILLNYVVVLLHGTENMGLFLLVE